MALGDPILMPAAGGGGSGGSLIAVTLVTATGAGNFVPNALTKYMRVRLVAGGGGGGSAASGGGGTAAGGAGGGAGGYAEKWYKVPLLASYPYVIGTGGAGGAGTSPVPTDGSNGTLSSFNTPDMICQPGTGGKGQAIASTAKEVKRGEGGTAAVAAPGLVLSGGQGENGRVNSANTVYTAIGGTGGSTPLGQGGAGLVVVQATSAAGNPGQGMGSGGGGGAQADLSADKAGGAGAPGGLVIEEYA